VVSMYLQKWLPMKPKPPVTINFICITVYDNCNQVYSSIVFGVY